MRASFVGSGLLIAALILSPCPNWGRISAAPLPSGVKLLVPAYFYPDGEGLKTWQTLIASEAKVPLIAIANPNSGPGTAIDPAYTAVIQQAQAAKIKVIGYVSTDYSKRKAADVKHDIDQWLRFYPTIEGIFFDEQSSEAAQADFYLDLTNDARKKISGAFIVTNPGILCAEEYFSKNIADTICVVERGEGLEKYVPPAWAKNYPAEKFYGLAYDVKPPAGLDASIRAASQKHLGYVYVTDDKLPNPWDTLPPYWDAEVKALVKP
ncbi:MAG: spherulation-specific family 4 protein [Planctomycetota bacterium]